MNLWALLRLLVFNTIRKEKFLTVLSVLGISLGIGLFTGVKIATDRAVLSFETDIQGLNPYANYDVVATSGIDFAEAVYKPIRTLESRSFPVLTAGAYLPDLKASLDLSGIFSIRVLRFLEAAPASVADMESFFTEPNGVMITGTFADKVGLREGDSFRAQVYNREYTLVVAGVLASSALPQNKALMDLGNYQELFDQAGRLSVIDIATDGETAAKIEEALPSHLALREKSGAIRNQQAVIDSFRYNLQFISLLAVLVGVFLLYNSVFISVVKRRTEIGILRGLGADRKTVVLLFLVQGLVLGAFGSALGILLGQLFAFFSVAAVERTISTIYRTVSISDTFLSAGEALTAFFTGLLVSLAASVIPALESARVRPHESVREGTLETQYRGRQKVLSATGLAAITAGLILTFLDYRYVPMDFPYLAYGGILLFILGCAFNAPVYLWLFLRVVAGPSRALFKAIGRMSIGGIDGSLYRFSVALMSVAISSALIIALLTSIFSLKQSLLDWIDSYIVADLYVKPASCRSNYCFQPLSEEVAQIIASFPEVDEVGRFRALDINFRGRKIVAGFGDTEIWKRYKNPNAPTTGEGRRPDPPGPEREASISDYLKFKYGLKEGDPIEIDTPKGPVSFTITNTAVSYSTTAGFVYLDRKWLREYWGLDDATQFSVYLKEGKDAGAFRMKLGNRLAEDYALTLTDNQSLRQEIVAIFDESFALTYAIELIAILVSLIGVINSLLILVFEKRREIAVIRYLGGTWQQIRQMMVLSAGIVGISGILLGTLMGPFIGMTIIHVINKISFGWEVPLRIPVAYLAVLTGLLFLTTLLAGLIPTHAARKMDPKRFISFE